MLKRYQTISIIYGGSGAAYAEEIRSLIERRSTEERYPITAKIVMENILTGDLLTNITNLFYQTEFCLAILTADDCCGAGDNARYRIRQNVVFELGMAIYRLGRERCILLSDFDPTDPRFELPSDFKGIDIKPFDPQNREQVFGDVLNKVLKLSSKDNDGIIPQYDRLLSRTKYFVNYEDLFSSCSHLNAQEGGAYLREVLNHWRSECLSLPHYEEKVLYFLERIPFIPMFGRHSWVVDWLVDMEQKIGKYREADIAYCGQKPLTAIMKLMQVVNVFTRRKAQKDYVTTVEDYLNLSEILLAADVVRAGVTNPLICTIYYDYLGLMNMCLYEQTEDHPMAYLEEAISCFSKVMDTYVEQTDMALGIWSGFVGYNLARCHLHKYNATNDPAQAKAAQNCFRDATLVRKEWLGVMEFSPSIRSALSYEYFICRIELISSLRLLNTQSEQYIAQEFKRVEGELTTFMIHEEQMERLSFVQDLLSQRQQSQGEESALSEDLL